MFLQRITYHRTLSQSLASFGGYLQQVTMLNWEKTYDNVITRVVTHWSYGNVLHYGLSMLNWDKMHSKMCGNAFMLW